MNNREKIKLDELRDIFLSAKFTPHPGRKTPWDGNMTSRGAGTLSKKSEPASERDHEMVSKNRSNAHRLRRSPVYHNNGWPIRYIRKKG